GRIQRPRGPRQPRPQGESQTLGPADVDAHGGGGYLVLPHVVPRPADAGVLQPHQGDDDKDDEAPGEVVKVRRGARAPAKQREAGRHQQAVGPAGEAPRVVDQRDADDLVEADGDDEQVVAPQVDDGPGDDIGEKPGDDAAYGE